MTKWGAWVVKGVPLKARSHYSFCGPSIIYCPWHHSHVRHSEVLPNWQFAETDMQQFNLTPDPRPPTALRWRRRGPKIYFVWLTDKTHSHLSRSLGSSVSQTRCTTLSHRWQHSVHRANWQMGEPGVYAMHMHWLKPKWVRCRTTKEPWR